MFALRAVVSVTCVPFLGGCVLLDDGDGRDPQAPSLQSISRDDIRVGERLEFLAEGLRGDIRLQFEGEYRTDGGSIHRVDVAMQPERVGADRLVIPYFGPFEVPFGSGDEIGEFVGTVTAVAADSERELRSAPLDVILRVEPSIIVRELASGDVSCDAPAKVLLGGGTLHIAAEAIGFEAADIVYRLGDSDASTTGDIAIPAVPDGALFATIDLALKARDGAGQEITSEYLFGVHRTLEQYVSGDSEVAEIEAAVPVSGCHSGGDTGGRELAYAEQTADVRARTVTYNWNETWLHDNGELDDAEGLTELALRHVVAGKRPGPSTDVWTVGYGPGEDARGPAVEPGTVDFWQISSADVLLGETGVISPGEFGVWYRQTTRLALPGFLVERDACGMTTVAGEAIINDYSWAVELATGAECPPFPESSLPDAECLQAPCVSQ